MNKDNQDHKYGPRRRKQRILVGTYEVSGLLPDFADGFRRLGYQVTTFVEHRNPFYPELVYDVDLETKWVHWPATISQSRSLIFRLPRGAINRFLLLALLLRLIRSHDVFFFLRGGSSLMQGNREYPLLKVLGKKIVSAYVGSDIRHISAYSQQFANQVPGFMPKGGGSLSSRWRNLRMGELFGDVILSVTNQSGLAVRPYMHFFVPIDLSACKSKVVGRDIPIVVHAPSIRSAKGTDTILWALERLRTEGVPFELHLLEGMPNGQVRSELTDADVVIDQLYWPLHGKLGVEAMASGCALATCNREDLEPIPPNRPIWHIDADNVYVQLKRLLTDKELRVRLAHEGRKHVEYYHDHVKVAQHIMECLDGGIQPYDHYPTFLARDYHVPTGEVLPDDLMRMTAQIVQRWGLPEDVGPEDVIARGLMSAGGLSSSRPIPKWESTLYEPKGN